MLTDIVAVLKLKCGIDALIFFAVAVGINREVTIQKGSHAYLCPPLRMERERDSLFIFCFV